MWWHMPLILILGRQRQVDLCQFKASLVYFENSETPRVIERPCLKNKTKTKQHVQIHVHIYAHMNMNIYMNPWFYSFIKYYSNYSTMSIFFKDLFIFILHGFLLYLHLCICTTCMSSFFRGQKRASDPPQLEFLDGCKPLYRCRQETELRSSGRAAGTPNW